MRRNKREKREPGASSFFGEKDWSRTAVQREKIEENIDTCEYTCNNKSIKEEVAR